MKNTIKIICLFFLSNIILFTSCSKNKEINDSILAGHIKNHLSSNNIILYSNSDSVKITDTLRIDKEGNFYIYKNAIKKSDFFFLQIKDHRIYLYLTPNNDIKISFNSDSIENSYKIENSPINLAYFQILKNTNEFKAQIHLLKSKFITLLNNDQINDSVYKKLSNSRDSLINIYRNNSLKIARKVNSPIIDYIVLNQKYKNISLFNFEKDELLFTQNSEALYSDPETRELFMGYYKKIAEAKHITNNSNSFKKGDIFPSLQAKTNWNENFNIKQKNTQLIHLIFWDGENLKDKNKLKQIKKLMYLYSNKNLKTMMIAYTKDKDSWLDNIKKYRLPYQHLIDTSSLQSKDISKLGIRYLPYNFVLDSTGHILSKDIWNKELDATISSYIKKY